MVGLCVNWEQESVTFRLYNFHVMNNCSVEWLEISSVRSVNKSVWRRRERRKMKWLIWGGVYTNLLCSDCYTRDSQLFSAEQRLERQEDSVLVQSSLVFQSWFRSGGLFPSCRGTRIRFVDLIDGSNSTCCDTSVFMFRVQTWCLNSSQICDWESGNILQTVYSVKHTASGYSVQTIYIVYDELCRLVSMISWKSCESDTEDEF